MWPWSEDGNRCPSFADEQLASENDNCLGDFACALFACLLVRLVGCLRSPKAERGLGGCVMGGCGETLNPKGEGDCETLNPQSSGRVRNP